MGHLVIFTSFPFSPVCGLAPTLGYRQQSSQPLTPPRSLSWGSLEICQLGKTVIPFLHLYPKWGFWSYLQRRAARMLW